MNPLIALTLGLLAHIASAAEPEKSVTPSPSPSPSSLPEPDLVRVTNFTKIKSGDRVLRRVDAMGNVQTADWAFSLEAFPDGTPNISIAVAPPKDAQVETISPGLWDPVKHTGISLFSRRSHTLSFEFKNASAKDSSQSLVIQLTPTETLRYVDPECERAGVRFFGPAKLGAYLFLHLQCEPQKDGKLTLTLSHPTDETRLTVGGGLSAASSGASGEGTVVRFDPAKFTTSDSEFAVGTFKITGTRDRAIQDTFEVRYTKPFQRWFMATGLSTTFMSYSEPENNNLGISFLALTGKIAGQYVIKADRYTIDGNIWGTLVPITLAKDPEDIPATRFLGMSLRGVYHLPQTFAPLEARWNAALGWYVWSMQNGRRYGVLYLSGPQLFLGAKRISEDKTGWNAYLKYAPIGSGLSSFSFGNYEIALGGGYTFIKWDYPITAVLDLARVDASSNGRSIGLTTVNLGFQIPIPFRKNEPKAQ